MDEVQCEERAKSKKSREPCHTLCMAAGLHGIADQEQACHKLKGLAMGMLSSALVQPRAMDVLDKGLNHRSIAATAMKVLQLPELLYLPECIRCHFADMSVHPVHGDMTKALPKLCFVFSQNISVSYYDVSDVEHAEPQQVGGMPCICHKGKIMPMNAPVTASGDG